jgi:hypothetical protein
MTAETTGLTEKNGWHKSGEWQEKVEMIEEEGAKRGITLKDLRSRFAKNTHIKN